MLVFFLEALPSRILYLAKVFFKRLSVRDFLRWQCEKVEVVSITAQKLIVKGGKKKLAEKMYIVKVIKIKIQLICKREKRGGKKGGEREGGRKKKRKREGEREEGEDIL